jgi:hypothetical protein
LDEIFQSHLLDEPELGLQPVDMLFLALENMDEQLTRNIVAHPLAKPGRAVEIGQRALLEAKIAIKNVLDAFAHEKLSQILKIRQAPQKQDAPDQPVRVFHLVERLVVFRLGKDGKPPIREHPRMKEILIDGGELVLQDQIERADDLRIARQGRPGRRSWRAG